MLLKTIIATACYLLFGLLSILFGIKPQYDNFLLGMSVMFFINILAEVGQSLWEGEDTDDYPQL